MESLRREDPHSIGGYELRACLGEGGFGRVYLGLSPGGRAVAVKVLRPELERDGAFLRRFRSEVVAAQQVNGFYTAQVVASGLDDRPPWVATAFVPGPPLSQAVAAYGPLPEPASWRLLAGLVEALQAIHACGLVHRDLKPANVMLAVDGPRVIDFGISKSVDGTSLTSTGAVIGTPSYMAPEQAEGGDVGPQADVFALGCVLAYAATGTPPFRGESHASVLYRIVHGQPVLDGIPGRLREVIERCLAKEPAVRPELAELAGIGRDGPGAASAQSPLAFWPPRLGQSIRDYQGQLDVAWPGAALEAPGPAADLPVLSASGLPWSRTEEPAVPPAAAAWQQTPDHAPYSRTYTNPVGQAAARPAAYPAVVSPAVAYPAAAPGQPPLPAGPHSHLAAGPVLLVRPGTVRAAVTLMYVAAGFGAVAALMAAFNHPAYAATSTTTSPDAGGVGFIAALAALALWLWLTREVTRGRTWARNVTTLLTLLVAWPLLYAGVAHGDWGAVAHDSIPVVVLMWAAGCAAVVLLWLYPSSRYFRSQHPRLNPPVT
jgi:serine/threonine kinase PknH